MLVRPPCAQRSAAASGAAALAIVSDRAPDRCTCRASWHCGRASARLQTPALAVPFNPRRVAIMAGAGELSGASHGHEQLLQAHHLPADVLRRALGFLPTTRDLLRAGSVCREWQDAALCDTLWQQRYEEEFSRSAHIRGSRSGGSTLGCPAASLFDAAPAPPAAPASALPLGPSWRNKYRERSAVESNWRAGRCSWVRLDGHKDYIRCAQLGPGGATLATCSGSYTQRDCSIRVWDVAGGGCLEHLRGHQGPIWSMQFDGRRVASCDDEGTVRLWDTDSHRVGVSRALAGLSPKCLGMDGRQVVVGGKHGSLALWSLADIHAVLQDADAPADQDVSRDAEGGDAMGGDTRPSLPAWQDVALEGTGHGLLPSFGRRQESADGFHDISCLQLDAGLCAAGEITSESGSVHLWSSEGDELAYRAELAGHRGGVTTLSFQHSTGWLVAGSGRGSLSLWDLGTGQLLRKLRGHTGDILCHQQSGPLLASGSADRSVIVWDTRCASIGPAVGGGQAAEAGEESGGAGGIVPYKMVLGSFPYCLQMDDRRLAVGCANGMVQVSDLRRLSIPAARRAGSASSSPRAGKLYAHTVLPAHGERVWAMAMSESHLISAGLDYEVIVRSFLPDDLGQASESGERPGSRRSRRRGSSGESDSEGDVSDFGSDAEVDAELADADLAYASSEDDWEEEEGEEGSSDEEEDEGEGEEEQP